MPSWAKVQDHLKASVNGLSFPRHEANGFLHACQMYSGKKYAELGRLGSLEGIWCRVIPQCATSCSLTLPFPPPYLSSSGSTVLNFLI